MTALAVDTLAYARRMEAVGFSREQAEALAEEQAKVIDERLATKADMEALGIALKADIAACATKTDLSDAKADILKWIIGSIGFQTLVILGAALTLAKMATH
jgi:hypothetical protein